MNTRANLDISSITVGNVTTVEVKFPELPHLTGKGLAIQSPGDKRNKEIGFNLALSRALANLANKFDRQAWGEIKFIENREKAVAKSGAREDRPSGRRQECGPSQRW